ncbi:hypothetical protein [Rhizobium sp. BK538]|uniref:hypothetical protein n=1 Tax=Rhizobium sp. BK538 TaxID=2586984 RepID=UPI0016174098|nr:hypothetical protein [Rhizobium sp. BK538]MBB4169871.1 hypothetical protein [Rhizobium sp. BK538]
MTKGSLRFFFDYGARGCLWADRLMPPFMTFKGTLQCLPEISLFRKVHSFISRLDQEHASYLNPFYPPGPSLWTQAKCERFNDNVDQLLVSLRGELGAEFVMADEQKRHTEVPTLGEFLAANPNQKPMR